MRRLILRAFVLVALLTVLAFGNSFSRTSQADDELLLDDSGRCTDGCDRNYVACCQRLQGNAQSCPLSCSNEQASCYAKCN